MKNIEPSFIEIDSIRTRYFDAGSGPPVMLVSGGQFGNPHCSTDWDRNFAPLAENFRVIAVDKLGQGWTDKPAQDHEYVIGSVVSHLIRFIEELELEDVNLVGHSRGGYAVTRIAMERPDLVSTLTVVDSGTLMQVKGTSFYRDLDERASTYRDIRKRHSFMMAESSFGGDIETDFWLDDIVAVVESDNCQEARARAAALEGQFQLDLAARRREVHTWIAQGGLRETPTLLVWAYNDAGATIEECGIPAMHLFLGHVPDARMYIFNQSGHFPYREWPDEFNGMLEDFLRRSLSPPGGERRRSPLSDH